MKKKTQRPELFMRLQDNEDSAKADCGCILRYSPVAGLNEPPEFLRCPSCSRAVTLHENLLRYFKESHQDELDHDHYGDGPQGCSYCGIIKKAEGK